MTEPTPPKSPKIIDFDTLSHTRIWELLAQVLGPKFAADAKLRSDVVRLSLAFTEDRADLAHNYFESSAIRRAYLAYFVPLNFWKVRTLLQAHDVELGTRWCDYGCGPGTATLAALELLSIKRGVSTKARFSSAPIEITLIDQFEKLLNEAKRTVETFAKMLGIEVVVKTSTHIPDVDKPYDLLLAANVLNELASDETLLKLWTQTAGTFLLLEPGHRVSSQKLVRFRERFFLADPKSTRVLGPCPHQERCPVYRSKHWCHFSEPLLDQELIELNKRIFKNARPWLKFSYLLVARGERRSFNERTFRAIGDLHPSGPNHLAIDLCQPFEKRVLRIPRAIPQRVRNPLVRGALVKIDDGDKIEAHPLTPRPPSAFRPKASPRRSKRD